MAPRGRGRGTVVEVDSGCDKCRMRRVTVPSPSEIVNDVVRIFQNNTQM